MKPTQQQIEAAIGAYARVGAYQFDRDALIAALAAAAEVGPDERFKDLVTDRDMRIMQLEDQLAATIERCAQVADTATITVGDATEVEGEGWARRDERRTIAATIERCAQVCDEIAIVADEAQAEALRVAGRRIRAKKNKPMPHDPDFSYSGMDAFGGPFPEEEP